MRQALWLLLLVIGCSTTDNSTTVRAMVEEGQKRAPPDLDLHVETIATELPAQSTGYRIGVKDVLDVHVPGHPEFGSRARGPADRLIGFRVKEDGRVYVPHVGGVPAAGRTELEVQADLDGRLGKFVGDAFVSVDVIKYASQRFYVLGAVEQPGTFPVDGSVTLLDGLGLAHGVQEKGDIEGAFVIRDRTLLPISIADLVMRGDTSRNIPMQHGDLVYVPHGTDRRVYVLGEVKKPGPVPIPHAGLTLVAALAEAGDLDMRFAKKNEIRVFRGSWQAPRVFTISAEDIYRYGASIQLRPRDVIHVAPRGLANWYRTLILLTPFLEPMAAAGVAGAAFRK